MKKLLTIALAVLLAMTAVSSMAIVSGGDGATGKKLQFDSISISTSAVLQDYALTSVSTIADPAATYQGDQMVFGYLKFTLDQNRPDDLGNGDDIVVHITSDYVTFPMYLNTGLTGTGFRDPLDPTIFWFKAKTHFLDKNGILQPVPYSFISTGNAVVSLQDFAYIRGDSDENEFIVGVPAQVNGMYPYTETWMNTFGSYSNQPLTKVNSKISTSLYVGFNGIVKASTSTQGVIKAYVTSGGSAKFVMSQYARFAGTAANTGFGDAGGNVLYIDKYKDGKPAYRVYKLINGFTYPGIAGQEGWQAYEYLVQPYEDEDTLQDWAVGFQNAAMQTSAGATAKYFGRFTYREGLNTDPDDNTHPSVFPSTTAPTFPVTVNAYDAGFTRINAYAAGETNSDGTIQALTGVDKAVNQLYGNGASRTVTSTGKAYKFFKVVEGGTDLNLQLTDKNQLDSKVDPIMEYFGFSYSYLNATNDSHYTGGGWKEFKETTFNYFGAIVPTDDDDVIPAETGDASMSIVIIMAASALMAAAALFFVMKKARD